MLAIVTFALGVLVLLCVPTLSLAPFTKTVRLIAHLLASFGLVAAVSAVVHGQTTGIEGLTNWNRDTLEVTDTLKFAPHSIFKHTLQARAVGAADAPPMEIETGESWAAVLNPSVFGRSAQVATRDSSESTSSSDSLSASRIVWTYRRFDTQLRSPVSRLDSIRLLNQGPVRGDFDPARNGLSLGQLRRELGAVDYRGTFGRGLRFGNSQSLVLDSRLDLQLDGDLGDGLSISAVVSDQNIPIQPEGNTVQLQEFDRIFVTIRKSDHSLTAGDYNLRSKDAHFLRFDKNLQGLTYAYEGKPKSSEGNLDGRASIAAARGQFTRIQLPVNDGNQGPYRLTGATNQPFVIVLAGTERITLNGKLLERGIDRDYTIDYNRGEVTFMPRLLINRFQRILVEYEFIDREYVRSLAVAETTYRAGAWSFYVSGLQQQDGLRRTGGDLSAAAEATLRQSRGSREGVLVPSASRLPDDSANPIRYARLPNPSPGCSNDSIFVYLENDEPTEAFTVSFTEVGQGQGEYSLSRSSSANGPLFEYVGRDVDCRPLGNYAAVRRVQTPRALRLLTIGGAVQVDTSFGVSWEVVGNQTDANRYSSSTQQSFAGHLALDKVWTLARGRLLASSMLEGTGTDFEAIAPWRDPEFNRQWNLGNLAQQQAQAGPAERLSRTTLAYEGRGATVNYTLGHYAQDDFYNGLRQNWQAQTQLGALRLRHQGDHLDAVRQGTRTGKVDLELEGQLQKGNWMHAVNLDRLATTNYDVVLNTASSLDREVLEWGYTTERSEIDSLWTPRLSYSGRSDWLEQQGVRQGDGVNHQLEMGLRSPTRNNSTLDLTATYRYTESAVEQPERYYLGRAAHRYRAGKSGWLSLQTTAELGSGQERRIAIQYLRVQPGLGQYVWRDYDNDGVEDLGEFEVAVFADSASYIRTTLLTDEFVSTNTLGLNQSINLDLGRQPKLAKGALGRLSMLNTASMRRRAIREAGIEQLVAVNIPSADTTVVGDDLAWRTALYLNRARNVFRAELEQRQLATRAISLQGLQQLRTNGAALKLMQPITDAWRLTTELDRERRRSRSEGLAGRNFTTLSYAVEPGVRYQPSSTIRVALTAAYREGQAIDDAERVVARSLELEADVRVPEAKAGKSKRRLAGAAFRVNVRRIDQQFAGDADSPAGFSLLEGLRPGRSWIWSTTADQQLGRALQLTLRYEGRQLGAGKVIHSGQAQLQAVF